jgi:ankyrin repeat protein
MHLKKRLFQSLILLGFVSLEIVQAPIVLAVGGDHPSRTTAISQPRKYPKAELKQRYYNDIVQMSSNDLRAFIEAKNEVVTRVFRYASESNLYSPLFLAAMKGDLEKVKLLSPWISIPESRGISALHSAIAYRHPEVAEHLVVQFKSQYSKLKTIEERLKLVKTPSGLTPLHLAVSNKQWKIAKSLLQGWPEILKLTYHHLEKDRERIWKWVELTGLDMAERSSAPTGESKNFIDEAKRVLKSNVSFIEDHDDGGRFQLKAALYEAIENENLLALERFLPSLALPSEIRFYSLKDSITPLNFAIMNEKWKVLETFKQVPQLLDPTLHAGKPAMQLAIESKQLHAVELLKDTPQLNIRLQDNWTPLHLAIAIGDVSIIKSLLGTSLADKVDRSGSNGAHLAASLGKSEVLELFLSSSLSDLAKNTTSRGLNILHIAVINNRPEMALRILKFWPESLLEKGKVYQKEEKRFVELTPLEIAEEMLLKNKDMDNFLLVARSQADEMRAEKILSRLNRSKNPKTLERKFYKRLSKLGTEELELLAKMRPFVLIEAFYDGDKNRFPSLLAFAAMRGDVEKIKILSAWGPLPEYSEISTLHFAAKSGQLKVVEYLVSQFKRQCPSLDDKKCLDRLRSPTGLTPLHYAVYFNWPEVANYLIGELPQILNIKVGNMHDGQWISKSALDLALEPNRVSLFKDFINSANKIQSDGRVRFVETRETKLEQLRALLYRAIEQQNSSLLEKFTFSDKRQVNLFGHYDELNPLAYAVSRGLNRAVVALTKSPALVKHADFNGKTALHLAAELGNPTAAADIMDNCSYELRMALPHMKDNRGRTAVDLAVLNDHPEVMYKLGIWASAGGKRWARLAATHGRPLALSQVSNYNFVSDGFNILLHAINGKQDDLAVDILKKRPALLRKPGRISLKGEGTYVLTPLQLAMMGDRSDSLKKFVNEAKRIGFVQGVSPNLFQEVSPLRFKIGKLSLSLASHSTQGGAEAFSSTQYLEVQGDSKAVAEIKNLSWVSDRISLEYSLSLSFSNMRVGNNSKGGQSAEAVVIPAEPQKLVSLSFDLEKSIPVKVMRKGPNFYLSLERLRGISASKGIVDHFQNTLYDSKTLNLLKYRSSVLSAQYGIDQHSSELMYAFEKAFSFENSWKVAQQALFKEIEKFLTWKLVYPIVPNDSQDLEQFYSALPENEIYSGSLIAIDDKINNWYLDLQVPTSQLTGLQPWRTPPQSRFQESVKSGEEYISQLPDEVLEQILILSGNMSVQQVSRTWNAISKTRYFDDHLQIPVLVSKLLDEAKTIRSNLEILDTARIGRCFKLFEKRLEVFFAILSRLDDPLLVRYQKDGTPKEILDDSQKNDLNELIEKLFREGYGGTKLKRRVLRVLGKHLGTLVGSRLIDQRSLESSIRNNFEYQYRTKGLDFVVLCLDTLEYYRDYLISRIERDKSSPERFLAWFLSTPNYSDVLSAQPSMVLRSSRARVKKSKKYEVSLKQNQGRLDGWKKSTDFLFTLFEIRQILEDLENDPSPKLAQEELASLLTQPLDARIPNKLGHPIVKALVTTLFDRLVSIFETDPAYSGDCLTAKQTKEALLSFLDESPASDHRPIKGQKRKRVLNLSTPAKGNSKVEVSKRGRFDREDSVQSEVDSSMELDLDRPDDSMDVDKSF